MGNTTFVSRYSACDGFVVQSEALTTEIWEEQHKHQIFGVHQLLVFVKKDIPRK